MSCGHVPQMVAESPAQAQVNDHVDRGVDHQQQVVDIATNHEKCRYVKFAQFLAMLKSKERYVDYYKYNVPLPTELPGTAARFFYH